MACPPVQSDPVVCLVIQVPLFSLSAPSVSLPRLEADESSAVAHEAVAGTALESGKIIDSGFFAYLSKTNFITCILLNNFF